MTQTRLLQPCLYFFADVAVCGLPDPRADHAVAMSCVAREYTYKIGTVTKGLEVTLGPDTGDLNIRIGLNR